MTATEIEGRSPVGTTTSNDTCHRAISDFSASASIELSSKAKRWLALGIFLLVLGVYALSSPGHIDIIDGQIRFDVAYNWLVTGRPTVTDKWIPPSMILPGRDGLPYSSYGAPASLFAIPLVWLGLFTSAPAIQPSQFLFSFTSAIFGAGVAAVLFLFYLELGVTVRRALAWTLISSFATYIWAISTSTFDNAQHAFFALAAAYLAFLSARRRSSLYAALGGLCAGVLFLYQEYFLLIIPFLALATVELAHRDELSEPAPHTASIVRQAIFVIQRTFQATRAMLRAAWEGPGEARSSCLRYVLFLAAMCVGVVLSFAYNDLRFGSWLDDGRMRAVQASQLPLWGNPLSGFLTLLVSPGKSVFLYSPPLILAILGIAKLWRRCPVLGISIAGCSLALLLFLSCIAFVGGDWCWGPRYLTPLLPLWALAFPFMPEFKGRRYLVPAILAAGVLVQALGLSVENNRFFLERDLNPFFWANGRWFYFEHSALFARFGETVSLTEGVPTAAQRFSTLPTSKRTPGNPSSPQANVPSATAPQWRDLKIFFLPRPWPLWMLSVPSALRPVDMGAWLVGLLGMTVLGGALTYQGLKEGEQP